MTKIFRLGFLVLAVMSVAAPCWGQVLQDQDDRPAHSPYAPEFLLGIGYSSLDLGAGTSINNEGAVHFDPQLSFTPVVQLPQLRLAFDLGVSLVLDNSNRTLILNNGQIIFHGSSEIPLWTLEPELNVSWRQDIGPYFYIEPGIGGGGMFAFLNLSSSDPNVNSYSANDQTPYGRAYLRVGVRVPNGSAGIEGSYLAGGKLDFGNGVTGNANEWYVGLFGAIQY